MFNLSSPSSPPSEVGSYIYILTAGAGQINQLFALASPLWLPLGPSALASPPRAPFPLQPPLEDPDPLRPLKVPPLNFRAGRFRLPA